MESDNLGNCMKVGWNVSPGKGKIIDPHTWKKEKWIGRHPALATVYFAMTLVKNEKKWAAQPNRKHCPVVSSEALCCPNSSNPGKHSAHSIVYSNTCDGIDTYRRQRLTSIQATTVWSEILFAAQGISAPSQWLYVHCTQYLRLVWVFRILLRWRHRRAHHRRCRLIFGLVVVVIIISIINLHSVYWHWAGGLQCRVWEGTQGCFGHQGWTARPGLGWRWQRWDQRQRMGIKIGKWIWGKHDSETIACKSKVG